MLIIFPSLSLLLSIIPKGIQGTLYCYQCEDCPSADLQPLRHLMGCPDESYLSCLATVTKFASYETVSRGCTRAPAVVQRDRFYHNRDVVCSHHSVNIIQASVCLCNGDGCNGKGLSAYYLETKRDDALKLETMDSSFPEGSENESNDGEGKTNQLISSAQNYYFSSLLLSIMIFTMI
ncbi:uncharacterized protein LOC111706069 [Eurytemora carolleeae]|uniref:uncharacterized protein LOC111706069 n=1 Tax=Eurytemora carolleeae TaxID=1294199 RepID=UPI000C76E8E7|nr:uncharacterized protein LOC111706069 [Eurytemora carolleeae]|eukprot:XP_023334630.1 uncharacterized protein LOC111706069 [Eurytemora affinis]